MEQIRKAILDDVPVIVAGEIVGYAVGERLICVTHSPTGIAVSVSAGEDAGESLPVDMLFSPSEVEVATQRVRAAIFANEFSALLVRRMCEMAILPA